MILSQNASAKIYRNSNNNNKKRYDCKKKAQKSHKNLSEEEKKCQYDRDGYNNFLRRR